MKHSKIRQPLPIQNSFLKWVVLGISTGFGLGLFPRAPGTFGSLLGVLFGLWLFMLPPWASILICGFSLILFSAISDRAAKHWGNMDDQRIVIDEVLGMGITLIGLRNFAENQSLALDYSSAFQWLTLHPELIIVGFVIFRALDILKPFPAKMFDRQPSGFGIMADDVVSGLYGALVLYATSKMWLT